MKDWIRLTGADSEDVAVNVSEISRFGRRSEKTIIYLKNEDCYFSVKESVDEILRLIEGEKAQDKLLERLKKLKEECREIDNDLCAGCKSISLCTALCGDPCNWDMAKVEEALR